MRLLLIALLAFAAPAGAAPRVVSIARAGQGFRINGLPARVIGSGDFKEVLLHPQDPDLVVKLFYAKRGSSVPELKRELADIARLGPATPALVQHGVAKLDGGEAGFLVQERVHGLTLARPTPSKLRELRGLFAELAARKLAMSDVRSVWKMRENLMVGQTKSGGWRAYLVDPEVEPVPEASAKSLSAFYDGLYRRVESGD